MGNEGGTEWAADVPSVGTALPYARLKLGQSDKQYFASSAHSCTMLKDFLNSRQAFHRYYVDRTEEKTIGSSQVRIGSAVHDGLLQGLTVRPYPDDCHGRDGRIIPKRRDEYDACQTGDIMLSKTEHSKYEGAVEAIQANIEVADALRRAVYIETPIYWQDAYHMEFRCKPDFVVFNGSDREVELWDLKVTGTPVEGDWEITARKLRYDIQVVHYSEGATRLWGLPVRFKFVVVGNFHPHLVRIVEPTEEQVADARWTYRNLLSDLRECYEMDDWREPN